MKLSGAQAIIKVLLEQGVDTVFGYPGGQVIPLYNALYDAPLRNVLTAHEQGAIHAADGYARASGRTGVCIATSGPGATNIVTGLATAYLDSVPLVAITGQVSVANLGRDSFQEIDIVGVTLPITKYNILVRKPEDLLPALRQAFYLAQEGRPGPVLVDVPSNLQVGDVEWMEAEPLTPPVMETAREEILEAAAVTITNARQPVFMVGGGAVHSGAAEEVLRFARKTGMPVVNTLMGIGVFPGSDRQCLGLTGMHGHIAANMAVANADVHIVAGSRFSERVTGDRNRYVGKKTIIQLDIDPSEVDKNVMTALPLVGDMKENLNKLSERVKKLDIEHWWHTIKAWDATENRAAQSGERLTAPWLMKELTRSFKGEDTVFVTDVGQNQMWAALHLEVDAPRHHLTSGGCGTMGFGLPAAMGAKFGAPDRTVCFFTGDGGMQMTIQELGTIMQEKLNVKIIILNNNFLGMVRQWQELFFHERYSNTIMENPDFVAIAKAYGIASRAVEKREELDDAIAEMLNHDGAYVLVANVETCGMVYPMVPAGGSVTNMIMGDEK